MTEAWRDEALHLVREGADLYVEQVGPADAPPVLFLHGGPGASAHAFREFLGEELERYRMVYLDQRGGGRSYADAPFDLDTLADDVAAVAAALDLTAVTLLAHGFGAAVAARTATRHPQVVRGQVWLNPWLSMPRLARALHGAARSRSGAGAADGGSVADGSAVADGTAVADDPIDDAAALADAAFALVGAKPLLDALLFPDPTTRLRLEHAMSTVLLGPSESEGLRDPWTVDVVEELDRWRGPVALLSSTGDGSSYPEQAEIALERLPHARIALFEGGHHAYADEPEGWLETLHAALAFAGAT